MMQSSKFKRDPAVGEDRAVVCSGFGAAVRRIGCAALASLMWLGLGHPVARAQTTVSTNIMTAQLGNSGFTTGNITQGGDITVEGWVYSWVSDDWARFVEMTATAYVGVNLWDSMNFCVSYGNSRKPFVEVWKGSTQYAVTAPDAIPVNTWAHVAYVVSGTSLSIYVNGTQVATTTVAAPNSVSRRITLGRNNAGGNAIYGHIADVRIWSVARTASQIQATMPMGSVTGSVTGLVAAWPLGVTGSSVLADVSGNNRSLQELGSLSLNKFQSGNLIFTGQNTYTSPLNIWEGTLQVGNGGTSGSLGSGAVTDNGILLFNRSDTITVSAGISGSGKVVQAGSGTLLLNGPNSFTGGLEVQSGAVGVGALNQGLSPAAGNTVTVGSGAWLSLNNWNIFGAHSSVPANSIVIASGGTLSNGGDYFSLLPSVYLNGGVITNAGKGDGYSYALRGGVVVNGGANTSTLSATSVGLGAVAQAGTTFDVVDGSAAVDLLVSGTLLDGPGLSWPTPQTSYLTKTGAGTMVLSGANTYSGTTTVSAGTLEVLNRVADSTAPYIVSSGATLKIGYSPSAGYNNPTITVNGAGVASSSGLQVMAGKTLTSNSGLLLDTSPSTIRSYGSGTATLAGYDINSAYFLKTTAAASGSVVDVGLSVDTGQYGYKVQVDPGANTATGDLLIRGLVVGTHGLLKYGTGRLVVSGNNTYSGGTLISAGALQVGEGGTSGGLGSGYIINNASLVLNRSDDLTVPGDISGTGTVLKNGAGKLTVTGNNTYSGTTTIAAGSVQVGNGGTSGALGTGDIVNNAALIWSRSDNVTVPVAITGTGSVTHAGTGALTMTGNNSYAGTTTLSGGTLQVGNGGTNGTLGTGGIVNNGTLIFNRSDSISLAGAHSGTGSISKRGAGAVTMALASAVQGDIEVTGGTLVLGASGNITSPTIRISGGAGLDASLRPAGLSLGSGQTLMNVGGTARIVGTVDATSGKLALGFTPGTPALSVSNGLVILAATTNLRITNNGAALGKGNYRILSKLTGGSVSGTVPPVSIEGGGIVAGGLATLSIVSGELILTVKAVTQLVSGVQPPEILFHQGFIVDGAGTPLGSPNPKNYELAFRMYTTATGGSPVWGERQTVTVDNGRFGIHLGEGDPHLGDPSPELPSVFLANEGTLYIETTVKGGGAAGADLVLMPRALLPPTAYAFLSRHARGAGNLVNSSNQSVLSVVGTRVGINNPLPKSALDVAGSIRSTNVIGKGAAVVGGTVTAKKFEGRGIVPVGGIIVWSGTTPPAGWALCDGQVVNGHRTPDLRGRFIVGNGSGAGLTAKGIGQLGGAETVALTPAQMPAHRHTVDIPPTPTLAGGAHNHVFQSGAGSGEGLGKDDNQNHWLYSGAYITQHRTDGAGNHNHFVDIPNFRTWGAGNGQPANNLPPFYAMAFIMRVE